MGASTTVSVTKYGDAEDLQLTVGATAVSLPDQTKTQSGGIENIFVQAHPSNSGLITILLDGTAVSGGAGKVLSAGSNINLEVTNRTRYSVIASTAGQKLQVTYTYRGD